MKEFITNGGNLIQKDSFDRYKINGQRVTREQVAQQVRVDGGKVHDLSHTDSKTKRFAQTQKDIMRLRGRDV